LITWRNILSYRTTQEEWEVGAKVRLIRDEDNHIGGARLPNGTTGTITEIWDEACVIVRLDWDYPTPHDYLRSSGRDDGWVIHREGLELI
jgi:hypothetical protein